MDPFHLCWDELELYVLGRTTEQELARIEEHILICHECQQKLAEVDSYVKLLRRGLIVSENIVEIHSTDSGVVVMQAQQAESGGWVARLRGADLDTGCSAPTKSAALKKCRSLFRQMFPGHQCGASCRIA